MEERKRDELEIKWEERLEGLLNEMKRFEEEMNSFDSFLSKEEGIQSNRHSPSNSFPFDDKLKTIEEGNEMNGGREEKGGEGKMKEIESEIKRWQRKWKEERRKRREEEENQLKNNELWRKKEEEKMKTQWKRDQTHLNEVEDRLEKTLWKSFHDKEIQVDDLKSLMQEKSIENDQLRQKLEEYEVSIQSGRQSSPFSLTASMDTFSPTNRNNQSPSMDLIKDTLNEREREIQQLKIELEELKISHHETKPNRELDQVNSKLSLNILELKREKENLSLELEKSREELRKKQKQILNFEEENRELNDRLNIALQNQSIDPITNNKSEEKSERNTEDELKPKERSVLENQIIRLSDELDLIQSEKQSFEEQIKSLEWKLESKESVEREINQRMRLMEDESKQMVSQLSDSLESKIEELNRSERTNRELMRLYEQQTNRNESSETKGQQVLSLSSTLEEELHQLKKMFRMEKENSSSLQRRLDECEASQTANDEIHQNLLKQIQNLNHQLDETKVQKERWNQLISKMNHLRKKENEKYNNNQSSTSIEEIQKTLDQFQKDKESLSSESQKWKSLWEKSELERKNDNDNLKSEKSKLESKIVGLQNDCKSFQSLNNELNIQLNREIGHKRQTSVDKPQEKPISIVTPITSTNLDGSSKEVEELEEKLAEMERKYLQEEIQLSSLREEMEEMREENETNVNQLRSQYEQELNEKEGARLALQLQLEMKEEELNEEKERLKMMTTERDEMIFSVSSHKNEAELFSNNQTELLKLKEELKEKEDQVTKNEERNRSLEKEISEMREEMNRKERDRKQANINEQDARLVFEMKKSLEEKLMKEKENYLLIQKELKKEKEYNEELQKDFQSKYSNELENRNLIVRELKESREETEGLEGELIRLKQDLSAKENESLTLKREAEELKIRFHEQLTKFEEEKATILTNNHNRNESMLKEKQELVEFLQSELESTKDLLNKKQKELDQSRNHLESTRTGNSHIDLVQKLSSNEELIRSIQKQNDEWKSKFVNLEKETMNEKKSYNQLEKTLEDAHKIRDSLLEEKSILNQQIHEIQMSLKNKEDQLSLFETNHKEQIDRIEELQKVEKSLTSQLCQLEQQNKELSLINEKLKIGARDFDLENKNLGLNSPKLNKTSEIEILQLKEKLNQEEEKSKLAESNNQETKELLKNTQILLEQIQTQLRDELESSNSKAKDLLHHQMKIDSMEDQLKRENEKYFELEEKFKLNQKTTHEMENNVEIMKKDMERFKRKETLLEDVVNPDERKSLELRERDQRIEELEEELFALEKRNTEEQINSSNLEQELEGEGSTN
eukprot:TRINITY_DN1644_c0_g1_i13.p1 TRINITY_DN1644_c0_g1~~TRINITY_DN1644_c0_g1_i13.p1  ORF type:complete len:1318 (+),score=569.43 TRINITY_DN1644_c0_g1_i13:1684-5637(+)